jgi:hypothetical protein
MNVLRSVQLEVELPGGAVGSRGVTEDPAIWRVAAWLVAKHGRAAAQVAQRHAALPPDEDQQLRAVWMRVTKATLELLRDQRRRDEPVN